MQKRCMVRSIEHLRLIDPLSYRIICDRHMTSSTEPIIIASEDQKTEVESTLGEFYKQVPSTEPGGAYSLRPGVNLLLYARRSDLKR